MAAVLIFGTLMAPSLLRTGQAHRSANMGFFIRMKLPKALQAILQLQQTTDSMQRLVECP
jgi:hypothetical protein